MSTTPGALENVRGRMERRLDRIAASRVGRRLDPWMGFTELRNLNPLLALIPMALLFVMGLMRTQFGHIDTAPGVFPIMALISGLNPVAGLLSALAYGLADIAQKFVTDDVFYEGVRTSGDYWGARIGYLLAYPALILFGVLPGALSRVGRHVAKRVTADQRGGIAGPPPPPPASSSTSSFGPAKVAEVVGAVLGAVLGTVGASLVWPGAIAPAFLLRPTADHSCHALSQTNASGAIPPAAVSSSVGGSVAALTPNVSGAGPSSTAATSAPDPPTPAASAAVAAGAVLGAPLPPATSQAGGTTATGPSSGSGAAGGGPTETVVVSGPEAITELIDAGGEVVTTGTGPNRKTWVKPPAGTMGSIPGIAFGPPITLPTGEVVIDPNNVAIIKEIPTRTGPTVTTQGDPAIQALVNAGFPTVPGPDGTPQVVVPPNLIHGNVTGVSFGGTKTVNGVRVIDPTKGVVIQQTGTPPTAGTGTSSTTPAPGASGAQTTQGPASAGQAQPPQQPPQTPPPQTPPPQQPPQTPPPQTPPAQPPQAAEVPIGPPRTPTDAPSLQSSLTQPGTTVITPSNVPAFVPDALTPDGKIRFKDRSKVPDVFKPLEGVQAPTPTIADGVVSVDLPLNIGHVDVRVRAEGGRLVAETQTRGAIVTAQKLAEAANLMVDTVPEVNPSKAVQSRLDRYNKMIEKAGLEVRSVTADGGQVKIVTGPR